MIYIHLVAQGKKELLNGYWAWDRGNNRNHDPLQHLSLISTSEKKKNIHTIPCGSSPINHHLENVSFKSQSDDVLPQPKKSPGAIFRAISKVISRLPMHQWICLILD